jgi:Secretion system C-terminal sorting domain
MLLNASDLGLVPVGTDNELIGSSYKMYPNPASEVFTLEFDSEHEKFSGDVSLRDMSGNLVHHQSINEELQVSVDIFQLPSGVYNVHLRDRDGRMTFPVQKLTKVK